MKPTIAWIFLLVLSPFGGALRAQPQGDIAKRFAGTWRLVSNPQRFVDGTTKEGSNSVAYAMFDSDASHMCFISMNPNRPPWKSETTPTPEEGLSSIRGFGAYCGTVEIHAKEGFIVRKYDVNQNPNLVGKVTKRWYTFLGPKRMSLRIDAPELNAPMIENTLIWERIAK